MRWPSSTPANAPPATSDLSMVELAEISPRGNVAVAIRCVERLSRFFQLPADFEDREACQSIYDAAVDRAMRFARGDVDNGERLQELIDAAYQMADLTAEFTEYSSYAAAHAVQAVAFARAPDGPDAGSRTMHLVASTFGACRVLIQRGRSLGSESAIAAIRFDLDGLKSIPSAPGIDPSEAGPLGPLWPEGPPPGF